jgi:hypothetical protein
VRCNYIGQAGPAKQNCAAWLFYIDSHNTTKPVLTQGNLGQFSTKVLKNATENKKRAPATTPDRRLTNFTSLPCWNVVTRSNLYMCWQRISDPCGRRRIAGSRIRLEQICPFLYLCLQRIRDPGGRSRFAGARIRLEQVAMDLLRPQLTCNVQELYFLK